jgi:hypothetical protein
MLVVKRRMGTTKQLGKVDNLHQRSPRHHTIFLKNSSRNVIKIVFNIDLHHSPIKVRIKKGLDAKKDGFIASRG